METSWSATIDSTLTLHRNTSDYTLVYIYFYCALRNQMKAAGEKPGRICNYQVRQLLFEKIYTHKDGIVLFKI